MDTSFSVRYVITSQVEMSSTKTEEEKNSAFALLKEIFEKVIETSEVASPKIDMHSTERKILCGYTSVEFKQVFPHARKMLAIRSFINSSKNELLLGQAIQTEKYAKELAVERKAEYQRNELEYAAFQKESDLFYNTHTFVPRMPLSINPGSTTKDLMKALFKNNQGIGIGDGHFSYLSFLFLIHHLPLFKEAGGTTIFWEGFQAPYSSKINRYFSSENPPDKFPKALLQSFEIQCNEMDKQHSSQTISGSQLTRELFKSIKILGLRLNPLEIRKLCEKKDMIIWADGFNKDDPEEVDNPDGAKWRIKPMNYCAQRILNTFMKEHPHEKFIFWGGYYHFSEYGKLQVPSIPTMTRCPWILIEDTKEDILVGGSSEKGKEILDTFAYMKKDGHLCQPDAILMMNPEEALSSKLFA